MNAHAEPRQSPPARSIATPARAEHISLEAAPDIAATPLRHPHRRTLSTFTLRSALRGCSTEVSILEDHYLSVRSQQRGAEPRKYVVDLRFANARPVISRHIAWTWLAAALVLLASTAGGFWWAAQSTVQWWSHPGSLAAAGGLMACGIVVLLFLRGTTESLLFTSVHGGVTLVSVTGSMGAAKSGRRFFVELIKNIDAAKLARAQSKQHFLRDEMREHHRLRELNVLSEADYEASKARILAAHS